MMAVYNCCMDCGHDGLTVASAASAASAAPAAAAAAFSAGESTGSVGGGSCWVGRAVGEAIAMAAVAAGADLCRARRAAQDWQYLRFELAIRGD